MATLKYNFDDKMVRKLIIKMGELAKKYQIPYDDRDMKAYENNNKLEVSWEMYAELLEELLMEE
jgi:hypothetical protein